LTKEKEGKNEKIKGNRMRAKNNEEGSLLKHKTKKHTEILGHIASTKTTPLTSGIIRLQT
jgi:hypothetical protein